MVDLEIELATAARHVELLSDELDRATQELDDARSALAERDRRIGLYVASIKEMASNQAAAVRLLRGAIPQEVDNG